MFLPENVAERPTWPSSATKSPKYVAVGFLGTKQLFISLVCCIIYYLCSRNDVRVCTLFGDMVVNDYNIS